MRPLLVLVIATSILGGVGAFLASDSAEVVHSHSAVTLEQSAAQYDVELTLTFDAGPDEFSLSAGDQGPSLLLQLNGQSLLRRTDLVPATESPILLRGVSGVVVGRNELFVQASPTDASVRPALRIRILRSESSVAEKTIWPAFGGMVQGTVALEVTD